ncbi:hypothetical protein V1511DRAFT_511778 [Dipodascopsis uninucleata]
MDQSQSKEEGLQFYIQRRSELQQALDALNSTDQDKLFVNLDAVFIKLSRSSIAAGLQQELALLKEEINRLQK